MASKTVTAGPVTKIELHFDKATGQLVDGFAHFEDSDGDRQVAHFPRSEIGAATITTVENLRASAEPAAWAKKEYT